MKVGRGFTGVELDPNGIVTLRLTAAANTWTASGDGGDRVEYGTVGTTPIATSGSGFASATT